MSHCKRGEMERRIGEMASRSGWSVSSKCQPNRPATVPEAKWEHFINTNSKGEGSRRWVYEHQRGRGQLPAAWSSSEVAADITTFLINLNNNRRKKKKNAISEFLMNDFVTKEYLSECNKRPL